MGAVDEGQAVEVVDWRGAPHPAPEEFTAALRKETGNERLEVFWDPTAPLFNGAQHPLPGDVGAPHPTPFDRDHGCWCVYMRVRVMDSATDPMGNLHQFVNEVLVPVLSMDGLQNIGLPFGLGQHVGMMLNNSDYVHRGVRELIEYKNAAHRRIYEQDWAAQESVSDTLGRDKGINRAYARARSELGISASKEEAIATQAKFERRYNLKKARQQRDLQEMGL